MHDYLPLRYHQATLDLLDAPPLVDAAAGEALEQFQRDFHLTLPASVHEWYSLQEAVSWLSEYSNDDYAIPIQAGAIERYWEAGRLREQDLARHGVLPILLENQAVCTWAIHLDGSDDPPVVVSLEQTRPFSTWEPYAATFSAFVYTRVWDYQRLFSEHALWGEAPCSSEELHFLRTHFQEEPHTVSYPTLVTYRFSRGHEQERVLIWWDEAQMQWVLSAPEEAALVRLTQAIESCGTLARHLPEFRRFDQ